MTDKVTARAFASIALVKYWGKLPGSDNAPATPSISLTLKALKTETKIERTKDHRDECFLNGAIVDKVTYKRLVRYLDLWRNGRLIDGRFIVRSRNSFPTRAGLASSSSGFAAMAIALSAFSGRKISKHLLSRLARKGSGSAARSIVGGIAAMPAGIDPAGRSLIPADDVPWGMVVIEVEKGEKKIGSREGMELCRQHSPYYQNWLTRAHKDYKNMLVALRQMDFTRVGEITEANAMAMHACIMASRPTIIYWSPATVEVVCSVRKWRAGGLETYFTIDAGPNVVLFCKQEDLSKVARRARQLGGVKSVTKSRPGGEAEIVKLS